MKFSGDYEPIYLRYPLIVKNKQKALESARKNRIEIGDWFVSPVHPNLSYYLGEGVERLATFGRWGLGILRLQGLGIVEIESWAG